MANNILSMPRGDNFDFDLTINDSSSENGIYILKDDDVVYFGLMDYGQPFEEALVKKRYTKEDCDELGNLTIMLEPSDTIDLLPGEYYYSVKLHRISNTAEETVDKVYTVIKKTKFIIFD